MKKIKMSLSAKSIKNAIKELQKYKNELRDKSEKFIDMLSDAGEKAMLEAINESPLGNTVSVRVEKQHTEYGCKAMLIAAGEKHEVEGRDPFYTVLAIEFGSGIHYNKIPNPKANEMEYGVGTYPGQIHAFEDGWYYLGNDDKWHYTHGVRATMPMYKAEMEIMQKFNRIAKEAFK